ncbi:MAG TPA: DUF1599 domain-containing protein [Parafilimonas sp.]|nr:DUF1599 domain-containing protein [Parafilimonas sp.]
MTTTENQFDKVIHRCKDVFIKKTRDYGTAWRVLRTISVVDQIFIKALRIRNIQNIENRKVDDDVSSEFAGIVNYALIGLVQLKLNNPMVEELSLDKASFLFDDAVSIVRETMLNKNHDYGEAWREMSQESFVDLILMKLMRIRQILSNDGRTLVSEGIDANYIDIANYAVFALILIEEGKHKA